MKLQGITSVLAAGVAVGLVVWVGASSEEQVIEAVPAPIAVKSPAVPAPAPGIGHAEDLVEMFGLGFDDPLGVYSNAYETWIMPGDKNLPFDPYNAPTPEVIQPDGVDGQEPAVVPLPTAPPTIRTETVEAVDTEAGALLSQPVRGRSTSKFGMRFHPVLRVYKLHTGHDWAAPCGTPVGAAAAGTVVGTGWAGGNGVQVKIDHGTLGGYRVVTTYNHLSSIGVKVGQKVNALQGVGRVGNTGYSTGCHLHFEVIANGQFTDPVPWLNGTPGIVDLSEMISVTPGTPASPSASPSVSPSPSVTVSPSSSVPESTPPPAPEPGETEAAAPSPSPSPSSTAPGSAGSPPPVLTPETPKPSVPAQPVPSSPSASPSPTPTASPSPSSPTPESPKPSEPKPSGSPSPSPSPEPAPTPPASTPTEGTPTPTVVLSSVPGSPSSSPSVTLSSSPSASASELPEPVPTGE